MAESLRRLANIGTFSVLQEKLDRWVEDFNINTVDQNVARGCEIIELNARVQGQLFKLLSVCASEGGLYGGASYIRSRLLPLLGRDFFYGGTSLSSDTSLSILAEAASKTRELDEVRRIYEKSLDDLEKDMNATKRENDTLRAELEDTKRELESQSRASTSDKMFADQEIRDLRTKLSTTESEKERLELKAADVEEKERKLRLMEDDFLVHGRYWPYHQYGNGYWHKGYWHNGLWHNGHYHPYYRDSLLYPYRDPLLYKDYFSDPTLLDNIDPPVLEPSLHISHRELSDSLAAYRYLPRGNSPLALDDPVQRARQQNLVARFNDMFSVNRQDALEALRRYNDDKEMNEKIVFTALVESFTAAKIAFRSLKSKVRSQLSLTHTGPETLEEAVQDYINSHTDLYDLHGLVQDVLRALARNSKLLLPVTLGYDVIMSFVRESCRLAWEMSALAHPLDVAVAADAELFDENKYRRSYDSEFTAPLVNHHIWPALMQGSHVLMKGEACTKRGASIAPRSRTPSRSTSRLSARSPSPIRAASPRTVPTSTARSSRPRTPDPSVSARTTSTSLSHYMK